MKDLSKHQLHLRAQVEQQQRQDTDVEETRALILDTANKIFADHCDKTLLDKAEQGVFAQALWDEIVASGFDQIGRPGVGTTAADMFAFIQVCGRHAVPLPIAETLLVGSWGYTESGLVSVGELVEEAGTGVIQEVNWGRQAPTVAGLAQGADQVVVGAVSEVIHQAANLAGEPRDSVRIEPGSTLDVPHAYAQMTLCRINLMAGVLQSVLDLGLQFAAEREQFGRSISKFQAIQHSLAVVASEAAAALRAADAAVDALGGERFVYEVAASKARIGEAVGIVAEQVHQIHGAMGFTHEHRLHHYTRRAWGWRDEWGNEFFWQQVLGRHLCQLGADRSWGFIATRS